MTRHSIKSGARRFVIIVTVLSSVAAFAATDLESWQNALGKLASSEPAFPVKPKGKCICTDPGLGNQVGATRQSLTSSAGSLRVQVDCLVPTFNATTGAREGFVSCVQFIPFPK